MLGYPPKSLIRRYKFLHHRTNYSQGNERVDYSQQTIPMEGQVVASKMKLFLRRYKLWLQIANYFPGKTANTSKQNKHYNFSIPPPPPPGNNNSSFQNGGLSGSSSEALLFFLFHERILRLFMLFSFFSRKFMSLGSRTLCLFRIQRFCDAKNCISLGFIFGGSKTSYFM